MSTDLSSGNWVSLYTTNSTTNTTFVLTDPDAATNKQRFYRVLICTVTMNTADAFAPNVAQKTFAAHFFISISNEPAGSIG